MYAVHSATVDLSLQMGCSDGFPFWTSPKKMYQCGYTDLMGFIDHQYLVDVNISRIVIISSSQ